MIIIELLKLPGEIMEKFYNFIILEDETSS
jgi:hypothetical protein